LNCEYILNVAKLERTRGQRGQFSFQ
jgi:hypothetical protein